MVQAANGCHRLELEYQAVKETVKCYNVMGLGKIARNLYSVKAPREYRLFSRTKMHADASPRNATELKIYKEQVAIYEQRAKFELTEREQRMDDQCDAYVPKSNKMEENITKTLQRSIYN
ncbi:hypothetical protein Tco_0871208 [Tanacetum coccineum]